MEALTRRFARSKIYKTLKEDDDSSGDEKANKGGGKKVKKLHPPIETRPTAQPALDRNQAKRERDLFIDRVDSTIKGDPKAYGTQLLLLIQGCPPSARDKVLKLLARDEVTNACEKNPEIAAAVAGLQGMHPAERGQVDTALALLVVDINLAMAEATVPGRRDFDFLQDPKVVALFAKLEKSLGEQQFDLTTLIATLCRGKHTTASQAKFVAGLMGHLIDGAHDRKELFDFQGFLSATLLSGMPGNCAKWIANSAVRTCRTAVDVERLVEAIEQVGQMSGMEIAHWMPLGLLATVVGSDIGNPKYIEPHIKAELEKAGLLDQFQHRLQGVVDNSRASNIRLAAGFNTPDQMEKDSAQYAELEAAHTAQLQEKKRKEEQQRREDVLKSVSVDVRAALKLMASNPDWDGKLQHAAAMSRKLQKKSLSIQQVVDDLVAVGTDGAAEFLGVLTAMLLADGKSELSREVLIATIKKSQLLHKVAPGLVFTWYATQARTGRSTLEITTDLCDALLRLKNEEINWGDRSHFYTECRKAMERSAIGSTQAYALTSVHRQVLEKIESLTW